VDRVGDHFLAGARLATDQHRGVGPGHLGDLLVDLLDRGAVADDAAERVFVAQLVAQVLVLFSEAAAIGLDAPPQLQGLRDHGGHDPIELERALVVAIRLERQHHLEAAARPSPDGNRHGDVGELAPAGAIAARRRQRRLLADARHHHRLAGIDHPFRDAVAGTGARPLDREPGPDRGVRVQLARFRIEDEHGAADDLVSAFQQIENRLERGLEIQDAGERLADFEQRGQPADFVGMVTGSADARVGHFSESYTIVGISQSRGSRARGFGGSRGRVEATRRPGAELAPESIEEWAGRCWQQPA
jgi:hypothetical protein